jgi:putative nucleotidyltransferase with HDIG domain
MKLPTREKCFELMDKYSMYDNIKKHSVVVEKVGVYLAKELQKSGINVADDLVSRASLLHDIAKVDEIEGRGRHDKIGEQILAKEGYAELGKFCSKHYFGQEGELESWEEKLLSYADDRVSHDQIVSLEERAKEINNRYKLNFDYKEAVKKAQNLEREIFSHLDFGPEEISEI